jgi:hypothetical protein
MIVVAGCSGDDGAAQDASNRSGRPTTTLRPVDTSFTGQNSAEFCTLSRTYSDRSNRFGANPTPAQLRTVTREGQTAITQAVDAAPTEIKDDVKAIARTFTTFFNELEKVDFEADRLPPAALEPLQTPEFQQATIRFQAYIRTVCDIT